MGKHQLEDFLQEIPQHVRAKVREQAVSMTFRFGNNGTVMCNTAILVPIGRYWLRIAIVESHTPFLISNAVFRSLGAVIDTQEQTVRFRAVPCTVPLHLSSRWLFTLNVSELIRQAEVQASKKPEADQKNLPQEVLTTEEITKDPDSSVTEVSVAQHEQPHMCVGPEDMSHDTSKTTDRQEGALESQTSHQNSESRAEVSDQDCGLSHPSTTGVCRDRHGQGTLTAIHEHGEGPQVLRDPGGVRHPDSGAVADSHHQVREDQSGPNLRRCGRNGPWLLHVVPLHLRGLEEGYPPGVREIPDPTHGIHGGCSQHPTRSRSTRHHSQEQGSAQEQEQRCWKQGNWETLELPQCVRSRGSGGRRLVTGHDGREFPSREHFTIV